MLPGSFARALRSWCVGALVAMLGAPPAAADPCPDVMARTKRLIVVTAPDMNTADVTLETFVRTSGRTKWVRRSGPISAVAGTAGLAWGFTFAGEARDGEPVKVEGDQRTPAGVFPLGSTFGFEKDGRPGYLRLRQGRHVCVDDPASPFYSQIVPRSRAGEATSGEEMWAVRLYRRGIVVDYPTSRVAKAGSCIFLHVRRDDGTGTAGCVAAAERNVEELQEWVSAGRAAIAILPADAQERFAGCLP